MFLRIVFFFTCIVMPLLAFGQNRDACLVTLVSNIKDLKIVEARKIFYSGKCEFRFRDEFGEESPVKPNTILGLIEGVDSAENKCQQIKSKGIKLTEDDLRGIKDICGSNSLLYPKLVAAEKFSGVSLSDLANSWDKFVADKKSEWNQKEKLEEEDSEKNEQQEIAKSNSPEEYRSNACNAKMMIELAQKAIAEENEVGKTSGEHGRIRDIASSVVR